MLTVRLGHPSFTGSARVAPANNDGSIGNPNPWYATQVMDAPIDAIEELAAEQASVCADRPRQASLASLIPGRRLFPED